MDIYSITVDETSGNNEENINAKNAIFELVLDNVIVTYEVIFTENVEQFEVILSDTNVTYIVEPSTTFFTSGIGDAPDEQLYCRRNGQWVLFAPVENLVLGNLHINAYYGDLGKIAYDHSQASGNLHQLTFSGLLNKPTTVQGFGITDIPTWALSTSKPSYTTSEVTEAANLYFTYNRVLGTNLSGYVATEGTISPSDTVLTAIQKLSYKNHNPLTLGSSNGLSLDNQQLSLGLSSSTSNGALSNVDWITFNNKLSPSLMGVANGLATLGNDTKVPLSQLPTSLFGQVDYKGFWDASNGTPSLPSIPTSNGDYYIVSVAGTTTMGSVSEWQVGDWLIANGNTWGKVDNTDAVISVNGHIGAVVLNKSDIGLSNVANILQWSVSNHPTTVAGYGITDILNTILSGYVATSGTISTTDSILTALQKVSYDKHVAVTLGTSNGLSLSGQAISLGLSSTITTGALSSTDWNIFNNKLSNATHTGDVIGSTVLTLATVNANVGTFNNITVNGKGLVTSASNVAYSSDIHSNIVALNAVSGTNTGDQTLSSLAGQPQLNGIGFVKANGTTISYDSSSYYLASNPNSYISGITKENVESVLTGLITTHTHNYLSSFTETDPVFTAWNKSTGISITKSQVSDFPTNLSQFNNNLGNYGGWITGINSGMVTTALGYTPWNTGNHPTTLSNYGITDAIQNQNSSAQAANSYINGVYRTYLYNSAAFIGNWTSSNIWGIGGSGSVIRLGQCNTDGSFISSTNTNLQVDGAATFASTVSATNFIGSGNGLTSLPSGMSNYIQNQGTSNQAANIRITGDIGYAANMAIYPRTQGITDWWVNRYMTGEVLNTSIGSAGTNIWQLGIISSSVFTPNVKLYGDGRGVFLSTVNATQLQSTIATGTAPLTVASTTMVSDFNADLLDGQHGSYYSPTIHTHSSLSNSASMPTLDLNTLNVDKLLSYSRLGAASTNKFTTVDNANAVLTIDTYNGTSTYFHQLGFSSDGNMYQRRSTGAWNTVWTSGNFIPSNYSLNTHSHGNITNSGYIGSIASLPIITGTGGILQAGSFSTTAGTFCQGNDSRLSDARVASDVSAWAKSATKPSYSWSEISIRPTTVIGYGITDLFSQVITGFTVGANSTVLNTDTLESAIEKLQGQINNKQASGSYSLTTHVHGNITSGGLIGTVASLPIITGTGGILQVGSFGTIAGTFCQGNDSRLATQTTITGNAGTATILQTARTIWGQSFNGSANISGAITGATTGTFSGDVSATNFNLSSDRTLKTNIRPILKDYSSIDLVEFNFKNNLDELRFGVIAQDLLSSGFEEFVVGDIEGEYKVKYFDLLVAKLANAESRIKQLEDKYGCS